MLKNMKMWLTDFSLKFGLGDIGKGVKNMNLVLLWVNAIVNGDETFERVPRRLKKAVKHQLELAGLDTNGEPKVSGKPAE